MEINKMRRKELPWRISACSLPPTFYSAVIHIGRTTRLDDSLITCLRKDLVKIAEELNDLDEPYEVP